MAITTYTPDIADADYPSFTGVAFADPAVYGSHSNFRVDAATFLVPIQNEILAHQAALQALGAGVFETKTADYTIPDTVVSNTTYYCGDAAGPVAPVMTLPRAQDVDPGTTINFLSYATMGVLIEPDGTTPDGIRYGNTTAYDNVSIDYGNSVRLQTNGINAWYAVTATLDDISGGAAWNNTQEMGLGTIVCAPTGASGLGQARALVPADLPGNVVETAAINALAVTTAKINNLAVTNAKIDNGTIDLTAKVTGTLPVTNGGTGLATLTDTYVIVGNGSSAVSLVNPSTAGYVLTSNGPGVDPSFQAVAAGAVSSVSGTAGRIASSPTTGAVVLDLITTGVAAGSYTLANVTVDGFGRLTSCTSGTVALASQVTGTLPIANGGTSATTAGGALTALGGDNATNLTTGTLPLARLSGITTSQLSASAGITSAQLANTAVAAGSYTSANITVNAQGQLTAASSGSSGYQPNYILNPEGRRNDFGPSGQFTSNTLATTRAPSAAGGYARSRWGAQITAGSPLATLLDVRGVTGTIAASDAIRTTIGASNSQLLLCQIFPAAQFRARTAALSLGCRVRASGYTGTVYIGLVYLTSSGTDDQVPDPLVATWNAGVGNGITAWGTNVTLLASNSITCSSTFQALKLESSGALPGTQRNIALVVWTQNTVTAAQTIDFTEFQMTDGSTLPAYTPPDVADEDASINEYSYSWNIFNGTTYCGVPIFISNGANAIQMAGIQCPYNWPARKFVTPYSYIANSPNIAPMSGSGTYITTFTPYYSRGTLSAQATTNAAGTANIVYFASVSGTQRLCFMACSEL